MRLLCWAAAQRLLLLVLVLVTFLLHVRAEQHQTKERRYYIAAVEVDWKYWDSDAHRLGPSYKKVVFREYDEGFRQPKTHPTWLGLLGPTLRAEEGESIVVTFRNMATGAHSLHPHGVAYGKQSEGAHYFDNTSQKEKEDDIVQPNGEHVYYWEVTAAVAPQASDPACLTYTYASHQDVVVDYNSGLIGALLICKRGSLDEDGKQIGVHHEYVFLFGIFDEKESRYKASGHAADDHVKHTINGYTHGSLPDVSVCAHASVSVHLVGMSSEAEVFSVHVNGQVLQQNGHKMSSVGLISGSTATASMVAVHPGRWMMSSHTSKHIEAGMHGFVDVKSCDAFEAPRRRMTLAQKRESRQWKFFIAAEEIIWDYAPNMPEHIDEDFKNLYLKQSPTRIGQRYKKVVYTMYKNEFFTERTETKQRKNELGILGPVIRAQIRDVITIVFKNMASRPYSIYPHGLTIEKSEEGVNYPEGGNQSHGVQPGETHTYVWRVVEEDEPLDGDSRCLTRMYHSAVDAPRDIASGLIGPILICKSQSLNVRNVQLKADKEQHAMFAVFDENKSWYLDYNIRHFSDPNRVNKANPDFYKSNVMHTINGYTFESGELLGFCNGEVATWHLSSIGAQDYIQTATFYGHPFELHDRTEDFLSLYPMTGETITMNMDNVGVWLMASLNSHETTKGMRLKFQDVECFRDSQYEYNDFEDPAAVKEFTVWKPPTWEDIKKEEEATPKPVTGSNGSPAETDYYTDKWADQWGIRSLKNQSGVSDMEKLDLSFLDYDAVDVPDGDTNVHLNRTRTGKNQTFVITKLKAQNQTSFSDLMEVDSINVTGVKSPHQNVSENTTSASNSSVIKAENTTDFNKTFDTKNTTAHNATVSSSAGNVSQEITSFTLPKRQEATNVTLPKQEATNVTLSKQEATNVTLANNTEATNVTLPKQEATNVTLSKQEATNVTLLKQEATNVTLAKQEATNVTLAKQEATNVTLPNNTETTNVTLPKQEATNVTLSKQKATNVTLAKQEATNVTLPKQEATNVTLSKQEATNVTLAKQEATNVTLPNNTGTTNVTLSKQEATNVTLAKQEATNVTLPNNTETTNVTLSKQEATNVTLPNNTETTNVTLPKLKAANVTLPNKTESTNVTLPNKIEVTNFMLPKQAATNVTLSKQEAANVTRPNNTEAANVTIPNNTEAANSTLPKQEAINVTIANDTEATNVTLANNTEATNVTLAKRQEAPNVTLSKQEATNVTLAKQEATNVTLPNNTETTNVTLPKRQEATNVTLTKLQAANVTLPKQEATNVTVWLPGNATSHLETEKIKVTVTGDNETEQRLTRGDVFSYSTVSPNNRTENHSLPMPEVSGVNRTSRYNVTMLEVEKKDNITSDNDTLGIVAERENITAPTESFSNTTLDSSNLTVSSSGVNTGSSVELSSLESSEEVFIYLKENNTEMIKTTSVKTQGHNWTYDGTHQTTPREIPDHMVKYFEDQAPQTTPAPKRKTKTVNLRHKPPKGEGMKTRRRKVYRPQVRSGLPFSPRGFNPMTPRGARPNIPQPVSDEEELINMPVVIGVPRQGFSDYELYVPGDEPGHLGLDEEDLKANEYEYVSYKDPYSSREDLQSLTLDETTKYYLKNLGPNVKIYYITAEEVEWDYAGYGQKRQDKIQQHTQKTSFTKVVFRGYTDSSFRTPDIRGEMNEHLGILGPVIRAEVGQSIMVVFRNNANRPYSIHPNGVAYTKRTEGLAYEDGSTYWYKFDDQVQPNTTFTYVWKADSNVGPSADESDCRTWAYYSGVNPEKDIHSGLIGPLLVCRKGTLDKNLEDVREFMLLFMTFDESQSWYYEQNIEIMQRKSRRRIMEPRSKDDYKFHSINGIIYNLKGLRMYTDQLARWHLINMGGPKDFHSVHFHGQTFLHKKTTSYREAVFPLLPGTFATLEMYPSRPGLWQLETEVGSHQKKGMQTLFLVLDNDCYHPLGLQSGSVKDDQITAINTRGYWEPHLARLNNLGKYNAWSTEQKNSWIQVDFQRPVVISHVETQGAKQMFSHQYVVQYLVSYSTDRRRWIFYKGDSKDLRKVFAGNVEAYGTKRNTFFPPIIARFVRLHPLQWYNKATVRMEFYGCELDGCSVPLGIESGLIEDHRITASSAASSWFPSGLWKPSLARLNSQGSLNAWQAKHSDRSQWLQVELPHVKKITGIITQGAKSMGKEMYVMSYSLQYSDNGVHWSQYTDDHELPFKTFPGNTNNNNHVKNYIYPPIFSRFVRVVPVTWMNSITMRIELLGCEFE